MKVLDRLEGILSDREWLLGDGRFSVADVAVGAYLLYVPQVWPNALSPLAQLINVFEHQPQASLSTECPCGRNGCNCLRGNQKLV